MLASSSRRETRPENQQVKKVGCMSGIFYFLHLHRHHSRKRLSSGKRANSAAAASPPAKPPPLPEPNAAAAAERDEKPKPRQKARESAAAPERSARAAASTTGSLQSRRLSCDAPRSPTLPSEIRRSNSAGSPRKPPALVARLMGLDEDAPPPPPPPPRSPESAGEKRRKLLGALERCDEDLRALKKIIEALRVAESRRAVAVVMADPMQKGGIGVAYSCSSESGEVEEKRCLEGDGEQPSPVSVLDVIPSPPSRRRPSGSATARGNQGRPASPPVRSKLTLRTAVAPPPPPPADSGRHGKDASSVDGHSLLRSAKIEAMPRVAGRRSEGPFEDLGSRQKEAITGRPRRLPCSRAMADSVDEVWADGVWEERWELGRVGVALEGDILGDLVAEVVKELGFRRRCSRLPLPFDACRKRLCF